MKGLGSGQGLDHAPLDAYLGLGSNVGNRERALQEAIRALGALPETTVVAVSPVYETEAHVLPGASPQADHLNAAAHVRTRLAPLALLRALHAIEAAAGRDPSAPPWSPRPLDLDVLVVAGLALAGGGLILPHPRLPERRFALQPLADLAPDLAVPGLGLSVAELLARTPDRARLVRHPLTLTPRPPDDRPAPAP